VTGDPRDGFERDLAEDLAALADTPLPGRKTPDALSTVAAAADRAPWWRAPAVAAAGVVAIVATGVVLSYDPAGTAQQSSTPGSASASPGLTIGELRYSCGGDDHTFQPGLLDEAAMDLDTMPPGAALARFIENGRDHGLLPAGGWHLVGVDDSSASFVSAKDGVPTGHAQLRSSGDGWRVTSWGGGCHALVALGGLNPANWRLVPGQDITPETVSFLADVTEGSCVGGETSADRIQPPIIDYGDDRIAIAFTVEPPPGAAHFCIANRPSRVRVELAEPLGTRTLVDAGSLPWEELTSRLTERSADDVAEFVISRLEANREAVPEWAGPIQIVSVEAMVLWDALAALDMSASADPPDDRLGQTVWLIRANGPFVSYRGPRPAALTGTSGYFVIDDATGTIIATGFEGDSEPPSSPPSSFDGDISQLLEHAEQLIGRRVRVTGDIGVVAEGGPLLTLTTGGPGIGEILVLFDTRVNGGGYSLDYRRGQPAAVEGTLLELTPENIDSVENPYLDGGDVIDFMAGPEYLIISTRVIQD
jgi:hypothetical protein